MNRTIDLSSTDDDEITAAEFGEETGQRGTPLLFRTSAAQSQSNTSDYQSEDLLHSDDNSIFSEYEDPDAVVVDLAMQPLLWENAGLSCFQGGCPGVRCYLLPPQPYTKYASDENNLLIMSMENRIRFEGVDNGNPVIAIRWVADTTRTVTVHGKEYTYCDIAIECRNEEVYQCVGSKIKTEAVCDPVTFTYTTSVAVSSPTLFRQFLMYKYWETRGLWDNAASVDFLARIGRVRADVVVKMKACYRVGPQAATQTQHCASCG